MSSQLENPITSQLPDDLADELAVGRRHRTHLTHGVSTGDESIAVNRRPVDLMITATRDEFRSIIGDASPYVLTEHEVQLTGFPRHDRLLELGRAVESRDPKLVLLLPSARPEQRDAWRSLANSDELRSAAAAHGCRVELVENASPIDVQRLLAQGVVLVTDYSPVAFEMAYLERPVVYCQFDRAEFFRGRRRGSWTYEDDGFGPLTTDAPTATAEIAEILGRGGAVAAPYIERMATAFPFRDGECCRRTHDAIAALTVPLTDAELYRPLEPRDVIEGRSVVDELGG